MNKDRGDQIGYGYATSYGVKEDIHWESEYGIECKPNDIITMIVNLDNHQLQYISPLVLEPLRLCTELSLDEEQLDGDYDLIEWLLK